MDILRRAEEVKVLDCGAVFEGDEFFIEKGSVPKLIHRPSLTASHDPDKLTHVYSIAYYENDHPHFWVMDRAEVNAIRVRSKNADRGPWVADYVAMAVKTVIRKHANYLPLSAERARLLEKAFEYDNKTAGLAYLHQGTEDDITPDDRLKVLEERLSTARDNQQIPEKMIPASSSEKSDETEEIEAVIGSINARIDERGIDRLIFWDKVSEVAPEINDNGEIKPEQLSPDHVNHARNILKKFMEGGEDVYKQEQEERSTL